MERVSRPLLTPREMHLETSSLGFYFDSAALNAQGESIPPASAHVLCVFPSGGFEGPRCVTWPPRGNELMSVRGGWLGFQGWAVPGGRSRANWSCGASALHVVLTTQNPGQLEEQWANPVHCPACVSRTHHGLMSSCRLHSQGSQDGLGPV